MRLSNAQALAFYAISLACGGSQAQSPAPQVPPPASPGQTNAPSAAASGEPETTTSALRDSKDAVGTKLPEAVPMAGEGASTGAPKPASNKHGHEPGRGPADIRAIVVAHRDAARACYDETVALQPGIEGDLVIQWTIDPKGTVTEASLDSSRSQIADSSLVSCVTQIIRRLQFASSPGGFETRASYPFNFHPHHHSEHPETPKTP